MCWPVFVHIKSCPNWRLFIHWCICNPKLHSKFCGAGPNTMRPWTLVQGDVDLYIDGRSELCPFERIVLPSLVWKPYLYNSCLRGCRIDHKNSKFNRWYTNPLSRGYRRNMEKQPQVYRHINPCWCPPALTLIGKAVVIGVLQDPEVLRMTSGDLLQEVSMQSLS